ncbi:hypothetical protein JCM3774_000761 [Rhodotorula dairenensis]
MPVPGISDPAHAHAAPHPARAVDSPTSGERTADSNAAATASAARAVARRTPARRLDADPDEERIGPYLIKEEIGRGSFATVFRGVRYDTHAPVAIKAVVRSKLTAKLLENLESEISILKRIVHHNIVELKDCLKTDSHIYLIMDFCSAGDLSNYIRKRGDLPSLTASNQGLPAEQTASTGTEKVLYPHPKEGGLNETIVRCFLGQLVDGLRFMRNANVIHRDIKPQNLLLQPATASELAAGHPPGIPILKVADFGFARWLPSQSMAETLCGSPLYMAPEILRYEKYDAKADLWSVGAVLFEMSVGKPPFRAQNHVDLLRKIERGEDRIKFPDEKRQDPADAKVPTKVADDLKALIRRLLKRHPSERMSFEDFFREAAVVSRSGSAAQLRSPPPARPAREDPSRSVSPAAETSTAGASHVRRPSPTAYQPAFVAVPPVPIPRASPPVAANRASPSPTTAATPPQSLPSPQAQLPLPVSRFAPADDPPPFARRTSANPSAPSPPLGYTGGVPGRRSSSYTSRYGALPQEVSRDASAAAWDSPIPRAASVGQTPKPNPAVGNPSPGVDVPPTSAVDRFAASTRGADSLMNSNDSVLGTDYVVVEKRTVEINALADELAQLSPRRESIVARRPSRGFLSRPLSSMGNPAAADSSPPLGSAPPSPYPPVASDGSTPPFAIPPRPQPSHHPYSISSSPRPLSYLSSSPRSVSYPVDRFPGSPLALVGSPSAALAKAISNLSSLKIFGSPSDGILVRRNSARKPIPRSMTAPVAVDPEEERVLAALEETAQKALVLFEFADSKLLQLLPPTPAASTSTTSLGTPSYFSHLAAREQAQAQSAAASNPFSAVPTSPSMRRNSSSSSGPDRPMILASSAKADVLAAEATVLYLKALAFLQRGIERARKHWSNRPSEQHAASADFNDAVQWFRQRFNECYDKADFAKTRCQDELPETTAYAEKLVYDRALELSRAAAVNELRGENPTDCETAYETALWLLYALLDDTMHVGSSATAAESEEDRVTVTRFVHSITGRLTALRKKLAPTSGATTAGATTAVAGSPSSLPTSASPTSPPLASAT